MNSRAHLAVLLLALAALPALAQWQWIDKDGHKVYSDQPPPTDIPLKNILRQPQARTPASAPAAATAPATGTTAQRASPPPPPGAGQPRLPGKDAQLEARKKQADEEEAAKRKADEERVGKAKAENCERARRSQATLQSGIRLQQTNAKGEREVLDDAGRAAEAQCIQSIIDSNCG